MGNCFQSNDAHTDPTDEKKEDSGDDALNLLRYPTMVVNVQNGTNLKPMGTGKVYVQITVKDQTKKTNKVKGAKDPKFQQELTFIDARMKRDHEKGMILKVYQTLDNMGTGDTLIGKCFVNQSEMPTANGEAKQYRPNMDTSGILFFTITTQNSEKNDSDICDDDSADICFAMLDSLTVNVQSAQNLPQDTSTPLHVQVKVKTKDDDGNVSWVSQNTDYYTGNDARNPTWTKDIVFKNVKISNDGDVMKFKVYSFLPFGGDDEVGKYIMPRHTFDIENLTRQYDPKQLVKDSNDAGMLSFKITGNT